MLRVFAGLLLISLALVACGGPKIVSPEEMAKYKPDEFFKYIGDSETPAVIGDDITREKHGIYHQYSWCHFPSDANGVIENGKYIPGTKERIENYCSAIGGTHYGYLVKDSNWQAINCVRGDELIFASRYEDQPSSKCGEAGRNYVYTFLYVPDKGDQEQAKEEAKESFFWKDQKTLANEKIAKEQAVKREVEVAKQTAVKRKQQIALTHSLMSNKENLGRKICKNGMMSYNYFTGIVYLGEPQYKRYAQAGQVVGFWEGQANDGSRNKIRIAGRATDSGHLDHNPSDIPTVLGITTEPGVVVWDQSDDWFFCD